MKTRGVDGQEEEHRYEDRGEGRDLPYINGQNAIVYQ